MNKRIDCIQKGKTLSDGTRVDGHSYEALLAVNDRDTHRWYYFNRCMHCGHADVAYADTDLESQLYPEVTYIGGV